MWAAILTATGIALACALIGAAVLHWARRR